MVVFGGNLITNLPPDPLLSTQRGHSRHLLFTPLWGHARTILPNGPTDTDPVEDGCTSAVEKLLA